ncbi:MAG TPA: universal stress protein [Candidatus Nitrosotenuis sp.]|jgi:nucleotide-binding universal stress UspA family protein|nr:universal stress protein [Candidatus Nitrosotenuis sp.]
MVTFRRVLVPTDLSEYSLKALPYARQLVRSHQGTLILAACVRARPEAAPVRKVLELLGQTLELPFEVRVGVGPVVPTLTRLAAESQAELVIVSSHGRRGLSRRLLGSTAEGLVLRAPCPVLTVKEPQREFLVEERRPRPAEEAPTVHLRIQRILAPTDYSLTSLQGVELAGQLARAWGAELILVHVLGSLFEPRPRAELERVAWRLGPLPHQVRVQEGPAAPAIVKAAEEAQADLIVMATRGSRGRLRDLFGSTTRAVVRTAGCPVLTLRPDWQDQAELPQPSPEALPG